MSLKISNVIKNKTERAKKQNPLTYTQKKIMNIMVMKINLNT